MSESKTAGCSNEPARAFELNNGGNDNLLSLYTQTNSHVSFSISLKGEEGNWLATYKEGASNDWENVIDWTWCEDVGQAPGSGIKGFTTLNYASGTYEVRIFKNNSYIVEDSVKFTVDNGAEKPKISFSGYFVNANDKSGFEFRSTFQENGTSWIGIFNKGAESKSENLIAWSYVNGLSTNILRDDADDFEKGTYEARLFYNDSYNAEASVEVNYGTSVFIEDEYSVYNHDKASVKLRYFNGSPNNDKDWVALFKSGEDKVADNVIAWIYAGSTYDNGNVRYTMFDVSNLENGEYDIVYFLNDSYEQHGASGKLIVDR